MVNCQNRTRQFNSGTGMLGGLSSLLGALSDGAMPKTKAVKIQELTPRNPGAKRVRMTWGPYKIRGVNVCHCPTAPGRFRVKYRAALMQ
jgi:hypothetical protein